MLKAWIAQNLHPTTQKITVAGTSIVGMVVAFNWLTPVQASSVTAAIIALASFFEPVK